MEKTTLDKLVHVVNTCVSEKKLISINFCHSAVVVGILVFGYWIGLYLAGILFISPFSNWTSGGWWPATQEDLEYLDSSVCTIPRVSIKDLDTETFERSYRYRQPVLITFPQGSDGWTDSLLWSVHNLTKSDPAAHQLVGWGTSSSIVRHGGSGDYQSTIQEYMELVMHNPDSKHREPGYIFDRRFVDETEGLLSSFKLPDFLKIKPHVDDTFLFLGGSGSGVTFHKHADTWNGVVYGRKRWFIYPGNKTPPGGSFSDYSILQWYNRVYPLLTEDNKPIECIQEAGEILYLPESFYHGTFNLGDTIAVGSQKIEAQTEVEKLFYQVASTTVLREAAVTEEDLKKYTRENADLYEKVLQLWPGHTETMLRLSSELLLLGDTEQAEALLNQILHKDEFFISALVALASLLESKENWPEAEAVLQRALHLLPMSSEVYLSYCRLLVKHNRLDDLLDLISQAYYHVQDSDDYMWETLDSYLEQLGENTYMYLMHRLLHLNTQP